jgi:hypothetical protein
VVHIRELEITATVSALAEVPGAYRLRVVIPPETAPGLAVPLYLRQGDVSGHTVSVSIE